MSGFAVNEIACAKVFDLYRPSSDDPYVYYDPISQWNSWSADDRCTSSYAIRFHKSVLFSKDDLVSEKLAALVPKLLSIVAI